MIWVVSGGWFSAHEAISTGFLDELLKRGYTVFAVVHGSQPKYTIPEILQDMHRAVRFIRHHAKDYHIDPDRIGITGGSAGGHLSLMQGTAGDRRRIKAPRTRSTANPAGCRRSPASSRPPTSSTTASRARSPWAAASSRTSRRRSTSTSSTRRSKAFVPITDVGKILEIGRQISPITHVTPDDPPTLIIHGDKDILVPIQQAEIIVDKLKAAGVEAKLVVKKGEAHGWKDWHKDMATIADWFDGHLKAKKEAASGE